MKVILVILAIVSLASVAGLGSQYAIAFINPDIAGIEDCFNGIDDDGDELIDELDADCAA